MPRVAIWAAGLAGSLLLNGALVAGVWLAIRPEPVADQPMSETELDVRAYRLERTEARPVQGHAEQATESDEAGTRLAGGAIARTRADPAAVPAQAVAASRGDPTRLRPGRARAQTAAAADPAGQVVRPAAPQAARAGGVVPNTVPMAATTPRPVRFVAVPPNVVPATLARPVTPRETLAVAPRPAALVPIPPADAQQPVAPVIPAAFPVGVASPGATPAPEARADARPVPVAEPVSDAVPPAPAEPERITAALAFSGAGAGDVDPVSLAAFQSFVRPGDLPGGGAALRDGVDGLLARVPCARLQVAFDPDTTTLTVNGHVPEDGVRAPVLAALRAQMGADIAVSDNMLILPRPQCGWLSGIADVGLPQSTDQITNPLLIGRQAQARVFRFSRGQLLSLDMTAPDYDAYIYLDYFDAAGNVLHLEPNEFAPLRHATAGTVQQIGAKSLDDAGLRLVVGPPYGQEIAAAFATSVPLYDDLRPLSEPAAPYLAWLKSRVAQARDRDPGFKGEWVYFFVATSDR